MIVRQILALALALAMIASCGTSDAPSPAPAPAKPPPSPPSARPDQSSKPKPAPTNPDAKPSPGAGSAAPEARKLWVPRLDNPATFEAYSKEIGGERFAKLVIDVKSNAVYYFDVNVYAVHKDFIFGALYKKTRTREATKLFDRNYGKVKPDFIMVYLVHHLQQDIWTFAYWDGDLAQPEHVRLTYQRLRETSYLGDKVKFRPDSNYQEGIAQQTTGVPFILNDQLYKLADYAAFNKGSAVGKLRLVPPDVPESELTFSGDEIVVLKTPLSDITPVAGIISEQFSTPLSHVSLRARGWKIPNIGLRDAQKKLAALADKQVWFSANDVSYELRAATDSEIAAAKLRAEQAHPPVILPKADLATDELRLLSAMRAKDEVIYGPKAANLGEIMNANLPGFAVPEGFSIPFRFYQEHLASAGVTKLIESLLADPTAAADPTLRKTKLEQIRAAIEKAPLASGLRDKVAARLAEFGDRGVFVRSSTNAEDLPTFSGAGLHDTKPNVRGLDAVCDAIKFVWASTWTLRAYEARTHARIDQKVVYGSALIQLGVDATAAGVMVTVHPTDPNDERNYTINAKSGLGIAVVDGRKVPESLLVNWYNRGIRVLSRSDEDVRLEFDEAGGVREVPNPNKGKPVLTNEMAWQLAATGRALTKLFRNNKLDIEWVYAGDQLYIVQTRPL